MTLDDIRKLTAVAAAAVKTAAPGVYFLVILADDQVADMAGNPQDDGHALELLMAAFEQVVKQSQTTAAKVGRA